jgi:hypothetical protein
MGGQRRPDFAEREWEILGKLHLNHMQEAKTKKVLAHYKARFASMMPPGGPGGRPPGGPGGRPPGGPGGPGGRPPMMGGGMGRGGFSSAMRDKMRAMRGDYEKELGKILSKSQMAAYTKERDARRAMMRQQRGGR